MSADNEETEELPPQQQQQPQNTITTVHKRHGRVVKEMCVPNANANGISAAAMAQEISSSSTVTTLSTGAEGAAEGAVLALFKQTEDLKRRMVSVTTKIDKMSAVIDTLATDIYAVDGRTGGKVILPQSRRFSTIASTLSNIGMCGCCFGTIALVIIAMFVGFVVLALIAVFGPKQY